MMRRSFVDRKQGRLSIRRQCELLNIYQVGPIINHSLKATFIVCFIFREEIKGVFIETKRKDH
jgi:hypothetical protein